MYPRRSAGLTDLTPVRRKPSLDVSLTGLIYVTMWMFMGIAAMNSQANLLFAIFGLMAGILLISGTISRMVLRRLVVTRSLPDNGIVGEVLPINYIVRNEKRFWPSLSVTLAELDGVEAFTKQPHAYMLHCAAKQTTVVPAEIIPKRRGMHALDRFQVSTSFPFGFIKRATQYARKDTLLIYPAIAQVEQRLLQRFRSAEQSGTAARPQRDGSDEFYGVKEFRTGENPRLIHWRRSARTGTLVAREMTRMSPPRLMLLIDTHLPAAPPAPAPPGRAGPTAVSPQAVQIEKVIAMAASLADKSLETGLSVGIIAWSGRWACITPNRGKRHRRDLLSLLACLPVNRHHDRAELVAVAAELGRSQTTSVLLSRHAPAGGPGGLAGASRGVPVVISPADPAMDACFLFAKTVDFAHSMPLSSAPATGGVRVAGAPADAAPVAQPA